MVSINDGIFLVSFAFLSAVWVIDWVFQPSFMGEIVLFFCITVGYLWVIGFFSELRKYVTVFAEKRDSSKS